MTEILQVEHLSKQYPGRQKRSRQKYNAQIHSEHGAARIRNGHYAGKGFLCE